MSNKKKDTIDFNIEKNKSGVLFFSFSINGNKYENNIDILSFPFNLYGGKYSQCEKNESFFLPINCDCGISDCMGIYDGIYVRKYKKSIKWRIKDRKTRTIFGAKYFSFERSSYERAVSTLYHMIDDRRGLRIGNEYHNIEIDDIIDEIQYVDDNILFN